jgi:hypothetical protein
MSPPLGGLFHARGIGVNGSTWLRQRQPTANAILPEAERRPDMKKYSGSRSRFIAATKARYPSCLIMFLENQDRFF